MAFKFARIFAAVALFAVGSSLYGEQVELTNPSFEQGVGGYWINLPAAARIDTETSTQGMQSLCLEPATGTTINTVQFIPLKTDVVYKVSFDAKGDAGANGPGVALALMLQGQKPIMFWHPADRGAKDFSFVPGTQWSSHEFVFGPVPDEALGQTATRLGIFINVVAAKKSGKIWIDNLRISCEKATTPDSGKKNVKRDQLNIELPNPVQIYEQPSTVKITASDALDGAAIRLKITDCRDRIVITREASARTGLSEQLRQTGYYRLTASLVSDGRLLSEKTTTLAITTPLPADYYSTPEPAFGVWGGLSPEMLRLGGAKWTRELFFTVFQDPKQKSIPPTQEKLKARSPVKVIKCLNILHPFKKMEAVAEAAWPEIREKVTRELVSHRGLVDVWETQNEPMVGENFHGTMADVTEIIAKTSSMVRQNAPGVPLAGICINPMSNNQFVQITGYYRNHNMASLVDGVMLHPYIPNAAAPDTSGYVETLNRLQRELTDITGREIPLYISEIGYSTKPGGEVTELQQAAYIARVVLLNRRVKSLRACVWHIGLWNEATSPRELDYGILRGHPKDSPVREPKPSFAAWATVSRQTYNAEYRGDLEFGRGVRVLLFARQGKPLLVAYSLSGRPQQLKIPFSGARINVTDVCGGVSAAAVEKGVMTLTVDEAPVYLEGNSGEDLRRLAGMKVDFSPSELRAVPGETIEMTVSGELLTHTGAGLRIETPLDWRTETSDDNGKFKVKITVPASAAPGETTIFVHLAEKGESRSIWRRSLQVLPPVVLNDVKLSSDSSGKPSLTFVPTGKAAVTSAGRIKIQEEGKTLAEQDFRVNHLCRVALPQLKYGQPRQYSATVATRPDYAWQTALPTLNRFQLTHLPSLVTPDRWPSISTFDLADGTYSKHAVNGAFDRPEGKLYLGWNREYLLLQLVYRDHDMIVSPQVESLWQGDSLQFGFSVASGEMVRANNDGIQETSYSEFGMMPGPDGKCLSRVWSSSNRMLAELGRPLEGLKAGWTRHGDITTYSAEIPWRTLNVKNPAAGMEIKFSLLINDCDRIVDGRYQRHWLEWYGGIANGKEPSLYGNGQLAP